MSDRVADGAAPSAVRACARDAAPASARCDIAVVGGGLVGAPLALALADSGWDVVLLERRATPSRPPAAPLDQRCTALSAGSVRWLERQGLWSALAADACPIRAVHVSHRGRFGATRLEAAEQGVDALGQTIENRTALAALEARLETGAVRRHLGVRVAHVEGDAQEARLHLVPSGPDDPDRPEAPADVLSARLVIGVDGTESDVRAALGIGVRRVDYRQSAVLGTLALGREHEHVAHERFTENGPLALLPRPGRTASFVECVSPSAGEALATFGDEAFIDHIQSRFGYRLGRFVACGPRSVVPLERIEATRQTAGRAVLLGNAVRLLHPIAGQGYNLALRDVATLVETLAPGAPGAAGATSSDPGEPSRLDAFAAARRGDQRRVVVLTDALARGFRGRNAALSHLRALALVGLDTVTPLRRRFARAAMGMGG